MSDPYIGEIRVFAGSFAPRGWEFCAGQLLSISMNPALFSLLGTTYGGDGVATFGLPDLRGRAMVGVGTLPSGGTYDLGQAGGAEEVPLSTAHLPGHGTPTSSAVRSRTHPEAGTGLATGGAYRPTADADVTLAPVGGNQPHENMPPFLTTSVIIAVEGIFPSPA